MFTIFLKKRLHNPCRCIKTRGWVTSCLANGSKKECKGHMWTLASFFNASRILVMRSLLTYEVMSLKFQNKTFFFLYIHFSSIDILSHILINSEMFISPTIQHPSGNDYVDFHTHTHPLLYFKKRNMFSSANHVLLIFPVSQRILCDLSRSSKIHLFVLLVCSFFSNDTNCWCCHWFCNLFILSCLISAYVASFYSLANDYDLKICDFLKLPQLRPLISSSSSLGL